MKFFPLSIVILVFCSASFAQNPNVTLVANVNDYPTIGYNDCWGYAAPDGREYALLGVRNGTSIIDITDPSNSAEVAFISSNFSTWKDIKTYQNYAYVVNESGGGLQIIDLSNLPDSATLTATYNGFSTSHNIYIDEIAGILYAEGNSSEPVRVLSLADPLNPVQISSFGIECHDIYAQDSVAFVSEGTMGSFGIYDMSNPASPTFLQRINVPSAGYCHNAWLTEDGNHLITTEETSEKTAKMWNIQDINNIALVDEYLGGSGLAHNAMITDEYVYLSHYESGLKVLDIATQTD
ncbi:MAG: choice-of-anchor B family protein, partial [Ignavibacteria bacterium]|nr:choice-of-anchor B family protein [Ignavibacteria bacterium]